MWRILYVHSSDELYGADRSLLRLVRDLDRSRFEPIVVLPNDVPYPDRALSRELEKLDIETHSLGLAVLRRLYFRPQGIFRLLGHGVRSVSQLQRLIQERQIDLVHSNSSAVLSGALVAQRAGLPHIWHTREIYAQPRWLGRMMAQLLPAMSTRIVAVSDAVRQQLVADGCPDKKISVIHNGIDLGHFGTHQAARQRLRAEWNIADDEILVGMVGRISRWKGQRDFVAAAHRVVAQYPKARFVIVGDVPPQQEELRTELLRQISKLQLTERIRLEPFRLDMPDVFSAFDLFVLPSTLPDPYPTVLLEAMASGLPVVATNHGGSREMVTEGTGLLVPANDPLTLAGALALLLEHPDLRLQLSTQAGKEAHARFGVAAYVQNLEQLYEDELFVARN
ncbi:MAG: glycosyltransferase [Caldilineaceae bacterium]|nr:glycosyltransferase [Caldilineaceae bacterium]